MWGVYLGAIDWNIALHTEVFLVECIWSDIKKKHCESLKIYKRAGDFNLFTKQMGPPQIAELVKYWEAKLPVIAWDKSKGMSWSW